MLDAYCHAVLVRELRKADYDGKTAGEAFAWLTEPSVVSTNAPSGVRLTPLLAAATIGPVKANALAQRVLAALPAIGPSLLSEGVSLSDPATGAFLASLVGDPVTADDLAALAALGTKSVTTITPARMDRRFDPEHWPHVAPDGSEGGPKDPAIHGFPNAIGREEFDAAWAEARGA